MPTVNSFKDFRETIGRSAGSMPATSNLFQVILPVPKLMNDLYDSSKTIDAMRTIDYYATSVTLPSRAVTTGELNNIGQIRRYATGQTNSEVNMQFLVSKDNKHRAYFEHWMHQTASDSDNTVAFYDDYVCDIEIVKWENIGNEAMQATGMYKLFGAFPYNVGQMSLDNEQVNLLSMDVSFYFERYRFDQIFPEAMRPTSDIYVKPQHYKDTSIADYLDNYEPENKISDYMLENNLFS